MNRRHQNNHKQSVNAIPAERAREASPRLVCGLTDRAAVQRLEIDSGVPGGAALGAYEAVTGELVAVGKGIKTFRESLTLRLNGKQRPNWPLLLYEAGSVHQFRRDLVKQNLAWNDQKRKVISVLRRALELKDYNFLALEIVRGLLTSGDSHLIAQIKRLSRQKYTKEGRPSEDPGDKRLIAALKKGGDFKDFTKQSGWNRSEKNSFYSRRKRLCVKAYRLWDGWGRPPVNHRRAFPYAGQFHDEFGLVIENLESAVSLDEEVPVRIRIPEDDMVAAVNAVILGAELLKLSPPSGFFCPFSMQL